MAAAEGSIALISPTDDILASPAECSRSPQRNCQPLSPESDGIVLNAHFAQDGASSTCLQTMAYFPFMILPFGIVAFFEIFFARQDLRVFCGIPPPERTGRDMVDLRLVRIWGAAFRVAMWFFQYLP